MVRPVLALSLLILVVFSILPAFADTGIMSVVAGKTYQVGYTASGLTVQGIQTNPTYEELTASVQVSSPNASLELTIPRALLDSKQGSSDIPFIVVIDGTLGNAEEKNPTADTRTIVIPLSPDNKQIEIIGTYVAISGPGGSAPPPATPSGTQGGPAPAVNHTSPSQSPSPVTSGLENNQTTTAVQPTTQVAAAKNYAVPNMTQNILFRVPYLQNVTLSLSYIDMGVIGAIVIVIIIVIASVARKNNQVLQKRR